MYSKHAVGIVFVIQTSNREYKAFYLDPENAAIPEGLAAIFKENGYEIEQLPTEGQRYTNCGPEVIENFMLYLTGERLSQEDAITHNSRLVEQALLSSSDTTEVDSLVFKDVSSKQETSTITSNADTIHHVRMSSGDYVANTTVRGTVIEQDTTGTVIANVEPGIELDDLLTELFNNITSQAHLEYDILATGESALITDFVD